MQGRLNTYVYVHSKLFFISIRVAVVLVLGAASLIAVALSKAVWLSLLGKYSKTCPLRSLSWVVMSHLRAIFN